MGELAWQQIDFIRTKAATPTWPSPCEQSVSSERATASLVGQRRSGAQRHCALSVARPPSEEATCRRTDHPLSMASRQSALLHWESFHSEALAAFQASVMDDAGRYVKRVDSTTFLSHTTFIPALRVTRSTQIPISFSAAIANCCAATQKLPSSNARVGVDAHMRTAIPTRRNVIAPIGRRHFAGVLGENSSYTECAVYVTSDFCYSVLARRSSLRGCPCRHRSPEKACLAACLPPPWRALMRLDAVLGAECHTAISSTHRQQ